MLRVLVLVVGLTAVAHAQEVDFEKNAKKLTDEKLARYDREIADRSVFLRIYDLLDDARITNAKHAREHFVEAKKDFDAEKGAVGQQRVKFDDLKVRAERLDAAIDAYRAEAKTTTLKVVGGLVLAVILLFGGAIFALVKRKARR